MNSEISVLIIEDEELWSKHIKMMLADCGFTVAAAVDNMEDALVALEKTDFDIALVDININQRNSGIQLGKLISQQCKKPFIFITASVSEQDLLEKALEAGPSAFLQKPSSRPELFAAIQLALQNFKSHTPAAPGFSKEADVPDSFFIKNGNSYKKISWKDVVYLATEGNYTKVFTSNAGEYLVRSSLQKSLKLLIPQKMQSHFLQVNRSEAVQDSYITEIKGEMITTSLRAFAMKDSYEKELRIRLNVIS